MIFEKIDNTDLHSKAVSFSDVMPLILGKIPEDDMAEYIIELALKIVCDKKGKSIPADKILAKDFHHIQAHIAKQAGIGKKN